MHENIIGVTVKIRKLNSDFIKYLTTFQQQQLSKALFQWRISASTLTTPLLFPGKSAEVNILYSMLPPTHQIYWDSKLLVPVVCFVDFLICSRAVWAEQCALNFKTSQKGIRFNEAGQNRMHSLMFLWIRCNECRQSIRFVVIKLGCLF